MYQEPEINALGEVCEVLEGLQQGQIRRIINWISGRFGLTVDSIPAPIFIKRKEAEGPGVFPLAPPTVVSAPDTDGEHVIKRRGRVPRKPLSPQPFPTVDVSTMPAEENLENTEGVPGEPAVLTPPPDVLTVEPKEDIVADFQKYETFEELFLFSNTKTEVSKVLLTAAYLQEKENKTELSSLDISSALKDLGEELTNPSQTVKALLEKTPPQLALVGEEEGKHARKKFTVTNEGLKVARSLIKQ